MNTAVGRVVGEINLSDLRTEVGMQVNRVEAGIGRGRVNSGGVAIDPVCDRSISIVIVGVHAGVAFFLVAVPTFPHGGGAMLHQIPPRRVSGGKKQSVSDVAVTSLCECG